MAAAVPRLPVVRDRAGQRIGERVYDQRGADGYTGECAGQAEHLVVVEQQERAEGAVLQTFCRLTDAERELEIEGQRPGHCHDFSTVCSRTHR